MTGITKRRGIGHRWVDTQRQQRSFSQEANILPVSRKGQTLVQSTAVERVRVLLEQVAMISAHDLEGSSALHLPAGGGRLGIIDLLIDNVPVRTEGAVRTRWGTVQPRVE